MAVGVGTIKGKIHISPISVFPSSAYQGMRGLEGPAGLPGPPGPRVGSAQNPKASWSWTASLGERHWTSPATVQTTLEEGLVPAAASHRALLASEYLYLGAPQLYPRKGPCPWSRLLWK